MLLRWTHDLLQFARAHAITGEVDLQRFGSNDGAWAVVTGATSGIGEAYAAELAGSGFNVFLLSRNCERLRRTEEQLQANYGVDTQSLAVDFARATAEDYARVEERLRSLPRIGVLVNNVGVNYRHPEYFEEAPSEEDDKLIAVNVRATTVMAKLALKVIPTSQRAALVNVGSVYGSVPAPLLAVYSGTKAYVEGFSRALAAEVASRQVSVQCVTPGMVATKMTRTAPSRTVPGPSCIARASLARLGKELVLSPFWFHAVTQTVLQRIPAGRRAASMLNANLKVRAVALQKKRIRSERRAARSQ